jgi:hypothetical protein
MNLAKLYLQADQKGMARTELERSSAWAGATPTRTKWGRC